MSALPAGPPLWRYKVEPTWLTVRGRNRIYGTYFRKNTGRVDALTEAATILDEHLNSKKDKGKQKEILLMLPPFASARYNSSTQVELFIWEWDEDHRRVLSAEFQKGSDCVYIDEGQVEPLLYRVLYISSSSVHEMHGCPAIPVQIFLNQITSKLASFLDPGIKHLSLSLQDTPVSQPRWSTADAILGKCSGIISLVSMFALAVNLSALTDLHNLCRLTHREETFSRPANRLHPSRIPTRRAPRADVMTTHSDALLHTSLPLMPNLTHVVFNSASLCVTLYLVLRSSTQLEIIVFLSLEAQREREMETVCALSDEDIRAHWPDRLMRGLVLRRRYWYRLLDARRGAHRRNAGWEVDRKAS
ncbi:hypothetical protein B0H13DRAFT_1875583 [Mycena leptocephala]|nr:hypothetical protein B0H13DRAFT_1875583 [Mycena leptocephala]